MKKYITTILCMFVFLPIFVMADKTFEAGRDMANNYIYSLPEYSRYLKTNGNQPFGYDGTKVIEASGFSTGGFLNIEEYRRSITNNSSYLAPGIQYWLINGQALDLDTKSGVTTSGVRVTEYVLHGTRVTGAGTQTTPWEFVDGYTVKVGTTDKSKGTINESYNHVYPSSGAEYDFTLTLTGNYNVNVDECLKNKNGQFIITGSGNTRQIKVKKVIGDFTCNVDLGAGCNHVVFNDNGATELGMQGQTVYYKYRSGWFKDSSCVTPLVNTKTPKKKGYVFTGYKISNNTETTDDDTVVIDNNNVIKIGIDSEALTNGIEVDATYRSTRAIIYFSAINQNDSLVSIAASNTVPSDYVYPDGTPATDIRGKTHNYKLANGDIYINGVKKTFKNLVYIKESTATNYQIHHNTIKKYGDGLVIHGGGINNYDNSYGMNISKAGYIAQPGQEWKCASGNCTHTVYNQRSTSYTSDDFCSSQYSDCNVVLEVNWKLGIVKVNLDKQGGSGGSTAIYEKFDNGFYTDSEATNKMTTSANGISIPVQTDKAFDGYYTEPEGGGVKYIDATGKLTSNADSKFFSNEGTLYANWKDVNSYIIFKYSGNYSIAEKGTRQNLADGWIKLTAPWKIRFTSTGVLSLKEGIIYDVFLVGGGGGGGQDTPNAGAGGGGGYTTTVRAQTLSLGNYNVNVAPAGRAQQRGASSEAFGFIAEGGYPGSNSCYSGYGGNGGSGGRGPSFNCGSWYPPRWGAGSHGSDSPTTNGGKGQGTTTCEFEESASYPNGDYIHDLSGCKSGVDYYSDGGNINHSNQLYAGYPEGGSWGSWGYKNSGCGGIASGGNGNPNASGGCSGIVIIRSKRQ